MPSARRAAWILLAGAVVAGRLCGDDGLAVVGRDWARILPPSGAQVSDYQDAGYRLVWQGAEVRVEVDASPLGSTAPFVPPRQWGHDPVARLARALVSGAETDYAAISRVLGWVARHLEYRLDRGEPQDAAAVLSRRGGYCTGIARLTVSLLRSAGIEAREVAGYVAGGGETRGYHRWIEAYLPDRGWVMSDPLSSHHYVPANYLRLASDELYPERGFDGLLLERSDRITVVDLYPRAPPGVTARRNSSLQLAAALTVEVAGAASGTAVLAGLTTRYHHDLIDGRASFVGLAIGHYRLLLRLAGGAVVERSVDLLDRRAAALSLPWPVSKDR